MEEWYRTHNKIGDQEENHQNNTYNLNQKRLKNTIQLVKNEAVELLPNDDSSGGSQYKNIEMIIVVLDRTFLKIVKGNKSKNDDGHFSETSIEKNNNKHENVLVIYIGSDIRIVLQKYWKGSLW